MNDLLRVIKTGPMTAEEVAGRTGINAASPRLSESRERRGAIMDNIAKMTRRMSEAEYDRARAELSARTAGDSRPIVESCPPSPPAAVVSTPTDKTGLRVAGPTWPGRPWDCLAHNEEKIVSYSAKQQRVR
jgi:hypothetical protein